MNGLLDRLILDSQDATPGLTFPQTDPVVPSSLFGSATSHNNAKVIDINKSPLGLEENVFRCTKEGIAIESDHSGRGGKDPIISKAIASLSSST